MERYYSTGQNPQQAVAPTEEEEEEEVWAIDFVLLKASSRVLGANGYPEPLTQVNAAGSCS
jgi:hypothetical protein